MSNHPTWIGGATEVFALEEVPLCTADKKRYLD
jgi:hypothetical protein